jgi:hypothetical protein
MAESNSTPTPATPSTPSTPSSSGKSPKKGVVAGSPKGSSKGPLGPGGDKGDLKDIDIATGVDRIPELWNRHGNTVLTVITVMALAFAGYRFWSNSVESARLARLANLASARDAIQELRTMPLFAVDPARYVSIRREWLNNGSQALRDVLGDTGSDRVVLAEALLLQGSLHFELAVLPEFAEAATRPTLRLEQSPQQLFEVARRSFEEVIKNYADRPGDVHAARLGLAAIGESTGDFAAAKTMYDAVLADAGATAVVKAIAKSKLAALPELSRPLNMPAFSGASTTMPSTVPVPATVPGVIVSPGTPPPATQLVVPVPVTPATQP